MKALVLAGGLPQIALLEELRSRNIITVLADYYENPVAKEYADIFYQVSTLDIPAIMRVAEQEKVDFLITVCTDQALLTVAYVSEQLGLPCYIDYQTARNVTNKSYMKRIFKEKGISSARFVVMDAFDAEAIKELRYPLIVKPVDCNSSKGVAKVTTESELRAALEQAVQFSRTNTAIVEEYIIGPELSVDVYVENGTAKILLVSELDKIPQEDKFIISRSKSPVNLSQKVMNQIRQTAQQIADAFHITNAPMLIQMISDGEQAYVLEFSARTGGGEKFIMIHKISGFDVVKAVVDLTLGEIPHVNEINGQARVFATEFLYCRPGVFHHLEQFEEMKAESVLSDYYCFKSSGSIMNGINSSGDRVAGFSMVAESFADLEKKHDIARRQLKVVDEQGADMLRRDLLTNLYDIQK